MSAGTGCDKNEPSGPAADFVSDCDHRVEVVYSAAHHWAARSGSYRHVGYVDKMTDG